MMEYQWEEPLCLIENTENGLSTNEDTLRKLSEVKVPVSVVAIVGLYRTGKSYLMNLLAGSPKGKLCLQIKCFLLLATNENMTAQCHLNCFFLFAR